MRSVNLQHPAFNILLPGDKEELLKNSTVLHFKQGETTTLTNISALKEIMTKGGIKN